MSGSSAVNICCLGDVMLGENHYHYGRGIRTHFRHKYNELISPAVREKLFSDCNIILYNFEYSLAENADQLSEIRNAIYRAAEDSLDVFPEEKLKIINIANNHFSQHGAQAAQYTKSTLKEKGFIVTGENQKPVEVIQSGKKLKFWGVSLIKDKFYCGEYFQSDYENLIKDLALNKKLPGETWIISVHWGDEYITVPSAKQISLAYKLADAGFDIIAGHHPHVVQPIEEYKNSVIIYSMGNFIFDQNFSFRTKQGLAVKLALEDKIRIIGKFTTIQKKYQVSLLKDFTVPAFTGKKDPFYSKKLKGYNYLMRLLMKLELVFHFRQVKPATLKYLLQKR